MEAHSSARNEIRDDAAGGGPDSSRETATDAESRATVAGVVLAGAHAWGESVLEQICPRPLLPIVGRPLVGYSLASLAEAGIDRATICANSDTALFHQCLGDRTGEGLDLSFHADLMPRGPAGCLRDAAGDADFLVVLEGSVLMHVDIEAMLRAHRQSQAALTMAVFGEDDMSIEPAGIYVVSRAAMECIPARGYQDLKEMLIPQLYERGQTVASWPIERGTSIRVSDASSYLLASSRAVAAATARTACPQEYERRGEAWIHRSARVDEKARLLGPVVVGPGCDIEAGATLVGPTSIGRGSWIGRAAVVSRSVLWNDCRTGPESIIDHSILVSGSRIEVGAIVRETAYVPEAVFAGRFDVRQSHWSVHHTEPGTPNLLDMLLSAEHVKPVPAADQWMGGNGSVRGSSSAVSKGWQRRRRRSVALPETGRR